MYLFIHILYLVVVETLSIFVFIISENASPYSCTFSAPGNQAFCLNTVLFSSPPLETFKMSIAILFHSDGSFLPQPTAVCVRWGSCCIAPIAQSKSPSSIPFPPSPSPDGSYWQRPPLHWPTLSHGARHKILQHSSEDLLLAPNPLSRRGPHWEPLRENRIWIVLQWPLLPTNIGFPFSM